MPPKLIPRSKPIPPSTPNKIVGAKRHLTTLGLFSGSSGVGWPNEDSYGLVKDAELSGTAEGSNYSHNERHPAPSPRN
jgi:hypothetical protein